MRIAVIGGSGKEGRGLALRWARAGHEVVIGSRDEAKARTAASEMSGIAGAAISGAGNAAAAAQAEVVLVSVPYSAHADTLRMIQASLAGKVLIDITVPIQPPKVSQVHLPPGQAAALEAQAIVGSGVAVVAALHHISSVHLAELDHQIDSDVMFCTDDARGREVITKLIRDLGLRPVDSGALRNAIALESLTPVLLHINRSYKVPGAGIRITGLPPG
jgi:NADPH-dependent F420 reductase